jgi:hypothetical protein
VVAVNNIHRWPIPVTITITIIITISFAQCPCEGRILRLLHTIQRQN